MDRDALRRVDPGQVFTGVTIRRTASIDEDQMDVPGLHARSPLQMLPLVGEAQIGDQMKLNIIQFWMIEVQMA